MVQSAVLGSVAPAAPLGRRHPQHVGHVLVQGSGLPGVDQPGLVRDDPVGELVGHHVQRGGEAGEQPPVAVPEDHALTVEEGVLVGDVEVDGRVEGAALVVQAGPLQRLVQEGVAGAEVVVGLVGGDVTGGGAALAADQETRELGAALRVADAAARAGGHQAGDERPTRRGDGRGTQQAQRLVGGKGAERGVTLALVAAPRDLVQERRR